MKQGRRTSESKKPSIFIIGESPLVEQYANICAIKGFEVYIHFNDTEQLKKFKNKNIHIVKSIPLKISAAIELTNTDTRRKKINVEQLDKEISPQFPILTSSITLTVTEQASWIKNKYRLVGISALPSIIDKPIVEIAPTVYTPKETIEAVARFYALLGKEIEIVQDRIGMVFPRIICQTINETFFAINEDIATPNEIDIALKGGFNFPMGPIQWAETIGLKQVYSVLSAIQNDLGEERYRVSPLLKQMAITNEWWKQENN